MTSQFKKIAPLSLAIAVGVAAVILYVPQALAQSGTQTICYRGRTLVVPDSVAGRYISSGATAGPCGY